MFRRFLDGLVFGSGFAIAFSVIQYAGFELFVGWNAPTEMYEVSDAKGDLYEHVGARIGGMRGMPMETLIKIYTEPNT